MGCEGVWGVEMKGPYGWERIGTAFMKDGRYLGASADHYSVGNYREDGKDVELSLVLTQYGNVRSVFGQRTAEKIKVKAKCKIKKNEILGTSNAQGIKDFQVLIRLTRLDSLDG